MCNRMCEWVSEWADEVYTDENENELSEKMQKRDAFM